MIGENLHRVARALLVAAVILFLAAPIAFGGGKNERNRGRSPVTLMVKTPAKLLARLAVTQSRLERHVSSSILHAGVDLFTRAVRRLLPREDRKGGDEPTGLLLRW